MTPMYRLALKSVAPLALSLLSQAALAGNEGGHGGGAVVCYGEDGSMSAQLLDLWEKEDRDGKGSVPRTDEAVQTQLERALRKLGGHDTGLVERMRTVLARMRRKELEDGQQIVPPKDTGLQRIRRRKGCSLQGAFEYDDRAETLTHDPEIVAAMGPTDLAAAYFHEALYRVWRQAPTFVADSLQARKLTGDAFGAGPLALVPPAAAAGTADFECSGGQGRYHLYVTRGDGNEVSLDFTRIAGHAVLDRTTATPTYDKRRDIGNNYHPRSIEALKSRLRDGLARTSVRWKKGDVVASAPNPGLNWDVLSTVSRYEPGYRIYFNTEDVTHGGRLLVNHRNTMALHAKGRQYGGPVELECKRLK